MPPQTVHVYEYYELFQGSMTYEGTFQNIANVPVRSSVGVVAKVTSLSPQKSGNGMTARLVDRNGGTSGVNLSGSVSDIVAQNKCYNFKNFEKSHFKPPNGTYTWLNQKTNSDVSEVEWFQVVRKVS